MKFKSAIWVLVIVVVLNVLLFALASGTLVLASRGSDTLTGDIDDGELSQHPSGKDRNAEPGNSGTQGKSTSNPDGDGADKRRDSRDGQAGGTQGRGDHDDNNGCGNDNDFADDNNGNCGGKNKSKTRPTPKPSGKPSPKPSGHPQPSGQPPVGGGTTTNNTNTTTNTNTVTNTNENKVEIKIENNLTQSQVAGAKVPAVLPETGAGILGLALPAGLVPLGFVLSRFGKSHLGLGEGDLGSFARKLFAKRKRVGLDNS